MTRAFVLSKCTVVHLDSKQYDTYDIIFLSGKKDAFRNASFYMITR